jgi:DNA-binding transcriptional regulator YhcF (GntR family)
MEFNDAQAIYLQIADYVCDQIQLQKWNADEKIPSVRELAVTLEVNPNTVMRSYEHLQQQNIIYTQRGMGYFVSRDAPAQINKTRKENFLKEELPQVFRKMILLGIETDDIADRFEKFKKQFNKTVK